MHIVCVWRVTRSEHRGLGSVVWGVPALFSTVNSLVMLIISSLSCHGWMRQRGGGLTCWGIKGEGWIDEPVDGWLEEKKGEGINLPADSCFQVFFTGFNWLIKSVIYQFLLGFFLINSYTVASFFLIYLNKCFKITSLAHLPHNKLPVTFDLQRE